MRLAGDYSNLEAPDKALHFRGDAGLYICKEQHKGGYQTLDILKCGIQEALFVHVLNAWHEGIAKISKRIINAW